MSEDQGSSRAITRRRALRDLGVAGLGASSLGGLLDAAAAAAPKTGSLKDIDHVVILIQENRSFDHYFGTLSGVRGFADKHGHKAFFQPNGAGQNIHPFQLRTGCLPDIDHGWGPQHGSWDRGRMDGFITSRAPASVDGPAVAPETMGYYKRSDLPFYYSLADAFTICDGYYCSVMGPTDPNRLMSMSASIDPAGTHGGPLVETLVATRGSETGKFTWPTMPESLNARGVSWKVYTSQQGGSLDSVLSYFKAYSPGSKLARRGLSPTFPDDFLADLGAGKLPQVSWLVAGVVDSEHPGFSTPLRGEIVARQIVEALASHPKTWRKTALFITWDENGGFFDHVAPPAAPPGTAGEYLTVATLPTAAQGIRGPIGLGFRVPMLVVSPFSRGGLVCSDTFDHTSTLRFLETRFGAKVPNLSRWRRKHTGDLTRAFNFAAPPRYGRPGLKKTPTMAPACAGGTPVPVTQGQFPRQEKGKRRRPSGP
ncbi:MAG: phospholipase [Actinomycetota bacterium]|nr:phospholipase [Actinomycetota bacterium]